MRDEGGGKKGNKFTFQRKLVNFIVRTETIVDISDKQRIWVSVSVSSPPFTRFFLHFRIANSFFRSFVRSYRLCVFSGLTIHVASDCRSHPAENKIGKKRNREIV